MSESIGTDYYQKIFHWAETQKDGKVPSFKLRKNDPYKVIHSNTFSGGLLIFNSINPGSETCELMSSVG